jgi:hypothetical protein
MEKSNAGIIEFLNFLQAVVRGGVVDQYEFIVLEDLVQDRADGPLNMRTFVVDGYDY